MSKREFTMLAHTWDEKKHMCGNCFVSEKLDGMRAIWDGGITRGVPKATVKWANKEKDARYKEPPIATGLWSRKGNVIHAPDWFLDQLPIRVMLDGELYANGFRQHLMSTVKALVPDERWRHVDYYLFDMPGTVAFGIDSYYQAPLPFAEVYHRLHEIANGKTHVEALIQTQLSVDEAEARRQMKVILDEVLSTDGEGVMIRRPYSTWTPERSWNILKVKPFQDREGIVMGYVAGRETDKGSRLLGRLGALIVNINGARELELSGFTDDERQLTDLGCTYAYAHPGERIPCDAPSAISTVFPIGMSITFKYRGLTADGIPMEARYWRKHEGD